MPAINPQLNETLAPYQFDGTVTMGGANASYVMSAMSNPADVNLKAWNFPTWQATGTGTFTVAGSVYLSLVHLNQGVTYSNIYTRFIADVGTASAGSNFAGIYNAAGTLVATTADLAGVMGTGTGLANPGYLTCALATAYTAPSSGPYYIGMFFNASGTASMPVFQSPAGMTAAGGVTSWAGTAAGPAGAAPFPFSAVATTSGTAMPATFALGSAGTTGAQCFWVGLA